VAPSDAKEKKRNIGAQLQSILYTTPQKDFGKFTSIGLLVRTNLFIPSRFGPPIPNLTLAVSRM